MKNKILLKAYNFKGTIILTIMIISYIFSVGLLSILYHLNYWTQAFDLGIFDQAIWLASKFQNLFITVRGLNKFGDHFDPIIYFLGLFYWIWDDVNIMLILHTLFIASGVIPIYLTAREKLKSEFFALAISFAYLCYPALINQNLDVIHPEAFGMTFIIYSFYFALKKKFIPFYVLSFLALICKEDIAITYFFVGIYLFLKVDKKAGLITSIFSIIYLFLCMKVIIPFFTESDFFRFRAGWFSEFYSNKYNIQWYLKVVFKEETFIYLLHLLIPVLFISIFDLPILLIAFPAFMVNVLSNVGYLRSIDYHYNTSIIPFIFYSTTLGFANILKFVGIKQNKSQLSVDDLFLFKKIVNRNIKFDISYKILYFSKRFFVYFLFTIFLVTVYISNNLLLSKSSINNINNTKNSLFRYITDKKQKPSTVNRAIKLIPKDASVSADYTILPHVSHRKKIYMFPNPFIECNWGINGEKQHSTNDIEYILVDERIISYEQKAYLTNLIANNEFEKIYNDELNQILLLKRIKK
ncbi:MAG TPA: DUF2079 domain-containing protein [Spirochaetota bacterium]|nr:DUF2079 domain-containing protein [Spirochaetota bacterium]